MDAPPPRGARRWWSEVPLRLGPNLRLKCFMFSEDKAERLLFLLKLYLHLYLITLLDQTRPNLPVDFCVHMKARLPKGKNKIHSIFRLCWTWHDVSETQKFGQFAFDWTVTFLCLFQMSRKHVNADDFDLSLTGSQISVSSSGRRANSSRGAASPTVKRPSSAGSREKVRPAQAGFPEPSFSGWRSGFVIVSCMSLFLANGKRSPGQRISHFPVGGKKNFSEIIGSNANNTFHCLLRALWSQKSSLRCLWERRKVVLEQTVVQDWLDVCFIP